jgi:hypothetical protein
MAFGNGRDEFLMSDFFDEGEDCYFHDTEQYEHKYPVYSMSGPIDYSDCKLYANTIGTDIICVVAGGIAVFRDEWGTEIGVGAKDAVLICTLVGSTLWIDDITYVNGGSVRDLPMSERVGMLAEVGLKSPDYDIRYRDYYSFSLNDPVKSRQGIVIIENFTTSSVKYYVGCSYIMHMQVRANDVGEVFWAIEDDVCWAPVRDIIQPCVTIGSAYACMYDGSFWYPVSQSTCSLDSYTTASRVRRAITKKFDPYTCEEAQVPIADDQHSVAVIKILVDLKDNKEVPITHISIPVLQFLSSVGIFDVTSSCVKLIEDATYAGTVYAYARTLCTVQSLRDLFSATMSYVGTDFDNALRFLSNCNEADTFLSALFVTFRNVPSLILSDQELSARMGIPVWDLDEMFVRSCLPLDLFERWDGKIMMSRRGLMHCMYDGKINIQYLSHTLKITSDRALSIASSVYAHSRQIANSSLCLAVYDIIRFESEYTEHFIMSKAGISIKEFRCITTVLIRDRLICEKDGKYSRVYPYRTNSLTEHEIYDLVVQFGPLSVMQVQIMMRHRGVYLKTAYLADHDQVSKGFFSYSRYEGCLTAAFNEGLRVASSVYYGLSPLPQLLEFMLKADYDSETDMLRNTPTRIVPRKKKKVYRII